MDVCCCSNRNKGVCAYMLLVTQLNNGFSVMRVHALKIPSLAGAVKLRHICCSELMRFYLLRLYFRALLASHCLHCISAGIDLLLW